MKRLGGGCHTLRNRTFSAWNASGRTDGEREIVSVESLLRPLGLTAHKFELDTHSMPSWSQMVSILRSRI